MNEMLTKDVDRKSLRSSLNSGIPSNSGKVATLSECHRIRNPPNRLGPHLPNLKNDLIKTTFRVKSLNSLKINAINVLID